MSGPQLDTEKPGKRPTSYLTVSQFHRLNWACVPVKSAFDAPPYLVGSVLHRKDFRDVDLRLPMWQERGGTDFIVNGHRRLLLLNCAISDWLTAMSGLPIDFQFQTPEEWEAMDGELRNPMGLPR